MSFKKFLNDSGDFLGNNMKFSADMLLSTVGANNVISQDDYSGSSKQFFQKASNVGGSIYKGIAPIAAGTAGFIVGGPMGAQIGMQGMKGIQGVGNSLNPQDERSGNSAYLKSQQTGNNLQQPLENLGNTGMGVMNMASMFNNNSGGMGNGMSRGMEDTGRANLGYRNGGLMPKYPNGGEHDKPNKMKLSNQQIVDASNFTSKFGNDNFQNLYNNSSEIDQQRLTKMRQHLLVHPIINPIDRTINNIGTAISNAGTATSNFMNVTLPGYLLSSGARIGEKVGLTPNQELFPNDSINNPKKDSLTPAQRQQYLSTHEMGGYNMYPNGGMQPNAEVELQENSIAPNGDFTQYNGPSHEQGGIQTNLQPGEMIFSDKLKLGNKTFADLNKSNNTNKEDKILEDKKSNSVSKTTAEIMKSAKLKNSQTLFTAQEQLKQDKVQSYAKRMGVTLPQFQQPSQNNQQVESQGQPQYDNGGIHKWAKDNGYVNSPGGMGDYYDPKMYTPSLDPTSTNDHKVYNWSKNSDPNWAYKGNSTPFVTYTPQSANNVIRPEVNIGQSGPKFTYTNNPDLGTYKDQWNKYLEQNPIPNQQHRNGGLMPKYPNGATFEPMNQTELPKLDNNNEGELMGNQNIDMNAVNDYQSGNQKLYKNYSNQGNNNPNNNKMLTQLALGLSQNAGNLYDLKNAKHVEVEKYDRMNPSLLDSSAEEQYNNSQGKLAVEDLRNASVGNSSTYIQNRKDLALNQMLTNARIKQANDNTNAQIKNGASQFNVNVDMQEKNANAMNRARAQDLTSNAYRQMGSNINSQYKDVQMGNRDNDMLKMIAMKNPQAANDPALLALFKKYGITY